MIKLKRVKVWALIWALALVLLSAFGALTSKNAVSLTTLPLYSIRELVNKIYFTGHLGRFISISLVVIVSMLPAFLLNARLKERSFKSHDSILVLLIGLIFGAIYLTLNESKTYLYFGEVLGGGMLLSALSITIYSLILAYLVLDLMGGADLSDTGALTKYLSAMVVFIIFLNIFLLAGLAVGWYMAGFGIKDGAFNAGQLVFQALEVIKTGLPYICMLIVSFELLKLFDLQHKGLDIKEQIQKLKKRSSIFLRMILVSVFAINLIYLVFGKYFPDLRFNLLLPLDVIIYILFIFLISGYISKNKELEEDNQLFI